MNQQERNQGLSRSWSPLRLAEGGFAAPIKRGAEGAKLPAQTLEANVYAGKRENAEIIKVENVQICANACRGSTDKYLYCALWNLEGRGIRSGSGCPVRRALRLAKSKIGASYGSK
jgi:hypothetical protein